MDSTKVNSSTPNEQAHPQASEWVITLILAIAAIGFNVSNVSFFHRVGASATSLIAWAAMLGVLQFSAFVVTIEILRAHPGHDFSRKLARTLVFAVCGGILYSLLARLEAFAAAWALCLIAVITIRKTYSQAAGDLQTVGDLQVADESAPSVPPIGTTHPLYDARRRAKFGLWGVIFATTVVCWTIHWMTVFAQQKAIDKERRIAAELSTNENQLERAIEVGDKDAVARLLIEGVDLTSQRDKNPLFVAILNGHWEIANLLLDHGATIDASDEQNYVALCVFGNQTALARRFIELGAEVDAGFLAHAGEFELLRYHFENDYDPRQSTEALYSRVCQPGAKSLEHTIKFLLDRDVPFRSEKEVSECLVTAIKFASPDLVFLLLDRIDNIKIAHQLNRFRFQTPLVAAAKRGDASIMKALLTKTDDPDETWFDNQRPGETPLEVAYAHGHAEIMDLLLAAGAKSIVVETEK